jgi:hypothetical protein
MSACQLWWASYFALGLLEVGCAGRFDPAHFEGSRQPQRAEPEAIIDLATRTSDLETLGTVRDRCGLQLGFRRLENQPLSDLDCSMQRLLLVLRESAAHAGGEVLVGAQCRSHRLGSMPRATYQVSCAAQVARYKNRRLANLRPLPAPRSLLPGTPAPSASDVRRIDEPDAALAFGISLDFEPQVSAFEGRVRTGSEVRELAELPLPDRRLGDLSARCEAGCDERALRYGLLIAAGRLGAPDVVGVRCFRSASADSCVGTLAAPERDE